jgi:hypothetical protein
MKKVIIIYENAEEIKKDKTKIMIITLIKTVTIHFRQFRHIPFSCLAQTVLTLCIKLCCLPDLRIAHKTGLKDNGKNAHKGVQLDPGTLTTV